MTATRSAAKKTAGNGKAASKTAAKKAVAKAQVRPPAYDGPTGELARPAQTPAHTTPTGQIIIQRIETETILIPLVGTAPLITHKFSEKAKRQMLDAMQGNRRPKEAKDPEKEYRDAAYYLDDGGYGIPAIAFKSATVSAARYFGRAVTMVGLRQTLFVGGEFSDREGQMLVRIKGEPYMREDVVRVGNGGTDLRYRPCWTSWSCEIPVTYVRSALTRDSVLSLVEAGGLGCGVGEWRPEKSGEYGTFITDPQREAEILR